MPRHRKVSDRAHGTLAIGGGRMQIHPADFGTGQVRDAGVRDAGQAASQRAARALSRDKMKSNRDFFM